MNDSDSATPPVDTTGWLDDALAELQESQLLRERRVRQSPHVGGLIQLDGRTYVDFSSNDYLSLSADPRLIDTVRRVVGTCGWGSAASPLVSGYGVWHQRLERELAAFEGTPSALGFPTGFVANMAAVTGLADRGDLILSDALNHASLVDGCRLSRATTMVYRHGDAQEVRDALARRRHQFRRALIVTDGLFSMDGDVAPLGELAAVAAAYDTMLVVDEAHATGVLGATGRGSCEWAEVESKITARVGTLSKALGGVGGFLVGPENLTRWIRHRGRGQMFSTALPEAAAAAAVTALQILRTEPTRREQLARNVRHLRERLAAGGVALCDPPTPIIALVVGECRRALELATLLRERGLFVPAIREPTVPAGTARLRISLGHDHQPDQLDQLAEALFACGVFD